MTILYVAGPMTGLPELNYPAFFEAQEKLEKIGFDVINPARREAKPDWEWLDYMRPALVDVAACDGIAILPNWFASRGARVEVHVAASIGLPVRTVDEWIGDWVE